VRSSSILAQLSSAYLWNAFSKRGLLVVIGV
jgi:hypothetical protein